MIFDALEKKITPSQREEVGIGGFVMFAAVRKGYEVTTDITDHFIEDGSAVNDHIRNLPITLQIEGVVGDIYLKPSPLFEPARELLGELGAVTQYLPESTPTQIAKKAALATSVTDKIRRVDSVIKSGLQFAEFLGVRDREKPIGEQFIEQMSETIFQKRTISVDMPYRVFENMAIQLFRPEWDNEGNAINFELHCKQLRFAETETSQLFDDASTGLDGREQSLVEKGLQTGQKIESSALFRLLY